MFWFGEQQSFCFSLFVACLQFPTSGTTFSQEPERITLEFALLYAQQKHGFHGNNSEGGCSILGSLWPWINNGLDASEKPRTFSLPSLTLFTAPPTTHAKSKRNEKLSQFNLQHVGTPPYLCLFL